MGIGAPPADAAEADVGGDRVDEPEVLLDRLRRSCLRNARTEASEAVHLLTPLRSARADVDVEITYYELSFYGSPIQALERIDLLAAMPDLDDLTKARISLARAVAEHRCNRWQSALRSIHAGLEWAGNARNLPSRIELLRTAATVYAWRGQHSQALLQLTLALADCAGLNDQVLLALLLGDCAKIYLEMHRHAHALVLLRRQEAIAASRLSDLERTRLHLATCQALIGIGQYEAALEEVRAAATLAEAHRLGYLNFVIARDEAIIHLRSARFELAVEALERAKSHADDDAVYERDSIAAVDAELALATGAPDAEARLTDVVAAFSSSELAPLEIEARLLLADAIMRRSARSEAFEALRLAMARARANGLVMLETRVREAMTRLDVLDEPVEESGRAIATEFARAPTGYVLLRKLGEGRFGAVFKAYDVEAGKEVALKRFNAEGARQVHFESARAEFRAAARVDHPGIARVFAFGRDETGAVYSVQQFVSGPTLREAMAEGDRPALAALRLMRRLAYSLAAFHGAGLAHNDVKPENIICPTLEQAVIVDLGLARLVEEGAAPSRGTHGYAAPEKWDGRPWTDRADIFSLGAIWFEWLTGRLPAAPARADWLGRLRLTGGDEAAIDPTASRLLEKMLCHEPAKRPCAGEVALQFERLIAVTGTEAG